MKKNLKHLLALCLTLALVFSLAACGQKADETPNDAQNDQQTEQEEFTPASYSIAALKGPTAMGLVKLMKDSESGETTGNEYTFTLAGSADEVTPALLKGELDMACVPANLAAVLYNKTEGEIEVLAVNTLGVLYILENGDSVQSLSDLAGKTVAVQDDSSALAVLTNTEDNDEMLALAATFNKLDKVGDYDTAFMNLASGAVDAIAMDIGVAQFKVKAGGDKYKILDKQLASEQYGVGFKKDNTQLRDKVQATLDEMIKDGTFMQIAQKWGLADCVINEVK